MLRRLVSILILLVRSDRNDPQIFNLLLLAAQYRWNFKFLKINSRISNLVPGSEKAFLMIAFYEIKYINMEPQRQCRLTSDVDLLSKPDIFLPYTRFVVWPWNHRISHSWLFLLGVCLERCLYFFSLLSTIYLYINHQTYTNKWPPSSCLYRASMTIKTLYYPTDAQIYNS